jgi:hypothetical protein
MRSATSRTLRGEMGKFLSFATACMAIFYLYFFLEVWLLKLLVGANSPSLCPTIFSVTYTGMNLLPLCTPKVSPTKSGEMVERLDHVFMAIFSPASLALLTFFCKWWAM